MTGIELPAGDVEVPRNEINEHDQFDRRIGLFIAVIAVLLSITAALAHKSNDQEIVHRVAASNAWSYYQAKRIRAHQDESTADLARVLNGGEKLALKYSQGSEKYRQEADEISESAKKEEETAERAERRGDLFDLAEVMFQVTVVLCSISILTKQRLFFRLSQAVAAAATVALIYAYFK
jgi:hypothetical protein